MNEKVNWHSNFEDNDYKYKQTRHPLLLQVRAFYLSKWGTSAFRDAGKSVGSHIASGTSGYMVWLNILFRLLQDECSCRIIDCNSKNVYICICMYTYILHIYQKSSINQDYVVTLIKECIIWEHYITLFSGLILRCQPPACKNLMSRPSTEFIIL